MGISSIYIKTSNHFSKSLNNVKSLFLRDSTNNKPTPVFFDTPINCKLEINHQFLRRFWKNIPNGILSYLLCMCHLKARRILLHCGILPYLLYMCHLKAWILLHRGIAPYLLYMYHLQDQSKINFLSQVQCAYLKQQIHSSH